jgi:hypothetical protein
MRTYRSDTSGRITAAGAALAATLAIGAMVDGLFAPAPTAFGAAVAGARPESPAIEVEIVPSRIEVVGVRAPAVADGSEGHAHSPRS